jgi:4-diphosphocytidyl-2-C-methyl-D-erythritol kinase
VLSKRSDGFHNLETCFYPVPWLDVLEIIPSDIFAFTSTGLEIPGRQEENLCIKAYQLLKNKFGLPPVSIHLHKTIPMGAGLGGGSSDAAYTLRLINDKFELNLSTDTLIEYASQLGSDCAFFIHDKPMLGTGRGEMLNGIEVSLKGKYLIIVKPEIHVSTADAFSGITPKPSHYSIKNTVTQHSIDQWKNVLKNDFEDTVFKKFPAIKEIKEKLYARGAIYASMSGSGAAVFGIFHDEVNLCDTFAGAVIWSGWAE